MSGLSGLTANILVTRMRVQILVVGQNKPTMPPFYDGLYTQNFVMPSWKRQADFLNSFLKFLVLVFVETLSILLQAAMNAQWATKVICLNSDFKDVLLSCLSLICVILVPQTKHSTKGGERSWGNKAFLLLRLPAALIIKALAAAYLLSKIFFF